MKKQHLKDTLAQHKTSLLRTGRIGGHTTTTVCFVGHDFMKMLKHFGVPYKVANSDICSVSGQYHHFQWYWNRPNMLYKYQEPAKY